MAELCWRPNLFPRGPHTEPFTSECHASKILGSIEKYYLSRELTDVVFIAGERRIPAHRLVLSAGSDYFAAMFTSGLKEASEKEIPTHDMNGDSLEALIKYCYTGKIEIGPDTAEELLGTANLLQLSEVVEACCRFLTKQLHPSNCIGIKNLADSVDCTELLEESHNFIIKHFGEVMRSEEFLKLSADELAEFFSSDALHVASEEAVLQGLLSWVENDPPSRKEHMSRLLKLIRFPLLAPCFIIDQVATCPLIRGVPEFCDQLLEMLKYHFLPECHSMLKPERTCPRSYYETILVLGGYWEDNNYFQGVEKYNSTLRKWTKEADVGFRPPSLCGITEFEGKIYACGGNRFGYRLNEVRCFDMRTKTYTRLPPMLTSRKCLQVEVLNGLLYAVGGEDGDVLDTVETYDPEANRWSYVESMIEKRQDFRLAVLGGKLYAVGGYSKVSDSYYEGILSSVECYDPSTEEWSGCPSMRTERRDHGVGVLNGHLYVVGGRRFSDVCTNLVERYDPKTTRWSNVAPMHYARCGVGVCVVGEKMFVVGGYNERNYLNVVEMYNPKDDVWVKVAPLNEPRYRPMVIRSSFSKEECGNSEENE